MKALVALAILVTGAPVVAASGNDDQSAQSSSQRKICTRLQQRGGSRLSERRVCLTERQWRERLGPDWRIALSGRNPEDDMQGLETQTRSFSNLPSGAPPTF